MTRAGRPGAGRPGAGRPAARRPGAGSPGAGRPTPGSPEAGSPEAGSPEAGRPEAGRPETGRPARGGTVAGGAQRFAARALAARRRPWRRLTFGAIVLTIVAVVSWLVLGSPLLAVGRILVVGANTSVEAGVQKAASSSLGTSMLRVDLAGLEATIEKDSRISDATVNRRFPRSLVVTVVSRVADANSGCW